MQLWEQGKLDLEADVRTYLPDGFLTRLRYDEPITMIHLMNHQGGFEDALMGLNVPDERDILPLEAYLRRYEPAQVYAPGRLPLTATGARRWQASSWSVSPASRSASTCKTTCFSPSASNTPPSTAI